MIESIKLTQFSRGGGCGCKIAPALLTEILSKHTLSNHFPNLLIGLGSSDDAAVYRLNERQAVVVTTDFFMPIVDDPFDFGRIAATNAISDIYAMGAQPLFALAIVGMPIDKLPVEVIQKILQGGEAICQQANIPIAGGHSIDAAEPIYGLVVIGLVHPDQIKRNDTVRAGDQLILTKPLGIGILSAALKKGKLSPEGYAQMISITTQLNTPGKIIGAIDAVHALTDVTGFGLLGHLWEMCSGANLIANIYFDRLPVIDEAVALVKQGCMTGASTRNWESYEKYVNLPNDFSEWQKNLLTDPQTSGGLLIACEAEKIDEVHRILLDEGFSHARLIGDLREGLPQINVAN